jgi:hypothetical protein
LADEPRGVIPKLIIFIIGLALGFWFAIPSEVDVGVMVLEALAKAIQPLDIEQANQIVGEYIILLRIFGVILILVDALGIYIQLRRKRFF